MDKQDEVDRLLAHIKEQADEILEDPESEPLSAEEIVVIAAELTLGTPIITIEYSSPIGQVDRSRVTVMINEEFDLQFPLFGEEYYEED